MESTQSVHYKVWPSASAFSYGSPAFIMTMMAMMTMMTLLTMITMITMKNMKIMMKVHKVYKQGLSGCNSLQSRVVPTPLHTGSTYPPFFRGGRWCSWRYFWNQGCWRSIQKVTLLAMVWWIPKRGLESYGRYEKYAEHSYKTYVHAGNKSTPDWKRTLYQSHTCTFDSWWYVSKSVNVGGLISMYWSEKGQPVTELFPKRLCSLWPKWYLQTPVTKHWNTFQGTGLSIYIVWVNRNSGRYMTASVDDHLATVVV